MPKDFHARLVVYGISEMTEEELNNLINWLENQKEDISKNRGNFSKRFTARLLK